MKLRLTAISAIFALSVSTVFAQEPAAVPTETTLQQSFPVLDRMVGSYNNWFNIGVYPLTLFQTWSDYRSTAGTWSLNYQGYSLKLSKSSQGYRVEFYGGSSRSVCWGTLAPIDPRMLPATQPWGRFGRLFYSPFRIIPDAPNKCGSLFVELTAGQNQFRGRLHPAELATFTTVHDVVTGDAYATVNIWVRAFPGVVSPMMLDTQLVGHPVERISQR